jgi:hypothetical protein
MNRGRSAAEMKALRKRFKLGEFKKAPRPRPRRKASKKLRRRGSARWNAFSYRPGFSLYAPMMTKGAGKYTMP